MRKTDLSYCGIIRFLNETIYADLEEIKNSQAVITVKGRKIKLASIKERLEINPKNPFYTELIKEGIKAALLRESIKNIIILAE